MPRPALSVRIAALALLASTAVVGLVSSPAHAAGSVTVDAAGQGAVIDSTYSTELRVRGSGFQSVKGGHGGLYVWFGTVNGKWRPSKGGQSGVNYVYVPDKETKDNAGFQRYVAFPGSSTASAANGGVISAKGGWDVRLMVPGPEFEAVGRNGELTRVDCRKVTCGVITIGAHGVKNANNETFTPVRLGNLSGTDAVDRDESNEDAAGGSGGDAITGTPAAGAAEPATKAKPSKGPAKIGVDHASAVAGRAMSFTVTGLVPGEQFTVVLDDGQAAAGPFTAGANGGATGVLGLPADAAAGTHEIRLFGASKETSLKFGVSVDPELQAMSAESNEPRPVAAWTFAAVAGVLFLGALVVTLRRAGGVRRAKA